MSKVDDAKEWLRKYLYWLTCGIVVVLGLTSWYLGTSKLEAESSTNLKQIDSHFDKAKAVATKTSPLGTHPNEETNKQLVALIGDTRKKVLDAWSLLYSRQKNEIFVWPKNLDPEFQDWLKSASPDAEIPTKFQVDYQNKILTELKRIVKDSAKATWPEKPDVLGESAVRGVGSGEAGVPTGPLTAAQSEFMIWNEADLLTYRNRYDWVERPVSLQVRLAQEDLWVLESICKVIAKVNDKFAPHERPIKVLEKLAIECYAAEERPNGVGENRIYRAVAPGSVSGGEIPPTVVGGEPAPEPVAPTEGAAPVAAAATLPTTQPPARRASGNAIVSTGGAGVGSEVPPPASETAGEPPAEGATATVGGVAKPEDVLLEWRYVNSTGVPLSKAQLDSDEHKHDLYRMMPFAMQFHITQNGIPRLFDAFKNASLPFEIREVRINPDLAKPSAPSGGSNFGFNESRPSGGGGAQANTSLLPGEVQMEIRGVVYLAQPFDEKKLGTPPPVDGAPTDQVTAAR